MVAMYEIVSSSSSGGGDSNNGTDDAATDAPSPSAPTPGGQAGDPSPTPVPTSDASSTADIGWKVRAMKTGFLALALVL
jgi:hypothetical protein